jgi:hypothetical protein
LFVIQPTEKIVTMNRTFDSIGKTIDTEVFPVCFKYRSGFETNDKNVYVKRFFFIESNVSIRCDNFLSQFLDRRMSSNFTSI